VTVTICDVGPLDGLQNEHAVLALCAAGVAATEDLVHLLHGEGVETGVDLDAPIAVPERGEGVLGRELPGQVYRAWSFAPVAR
jgi:hypothetical protein